MAFEIRVRPKRWLPRGEAVAEAKGRKPLVIWSGIPGEIARVRVVHEGKNQDLGLLVEALEPSPHRVTPACGKYSQCGGCPIMHVDPAGQEDARRALVRAALDHDGLTDVELGAFHASPDGMRDFRHVLKVGVGYSDAGRIRVGAWGRRNARIVPIPNCPVAAPVLRKVMATLAHHIIELHIRPYDAERDEGILRSAVIRASRTTGEVLITLIAARHIRPLRELAEAVAGQCAEVAGVWLHINDDPGNAIFVRDGEGVVGVKPLVGKETIEESVGGVTYRIGPGDFFQTNPAVAEQLYARTLERIALAADEPFVDLYCGVGGLALQAAKRASYVVGVEEVEGAVVRARQVARLNKLDSVRFVSGQVIEALPDLKKQLAGARPVLSVNPARRGLEEGVVDAIVDLAPRRVAYISCNPRALARDLALFRNAGFTVGAVEMFDMFPNTAHVECLTLLTAPDAEAPAKRAPKRRRVR